MNIKEIYNELVKKIPPSNIKVEEEMKKYTSFKIGGIADILVFAKSIEDIKDVLEVVKTNKIPLTIMGNGTNLLVKDNGIRGIVLKIDLQEIDIKKDKQDIEMQLVYDKVAEEEEEYKYNQDVVIKLGAGVKLGMLAGILLKEEIEGFEFASGIPGTIGGAIRMNAGAHGKEFKDIVVETTYIDYNGNLHTISNDEHMFSYRHSRFFEDNSIIISSKIKLKYGNRQIIKAKMQEYLNYRKEKQPFSMPSAGSTFKRGDDFITAKLIDDCGLKGFSIGDAEVSRKHAGFIVNKGKATAEDVLKLVEYVKKIVFEKTSKNIELEIEVIGD